MTYMDKRQRCFLELSMAVWNTVFHLLGSKSTKNPRFGKDIKTVYTDKRFMRIINSGLEYSLTLVG